MKRQQIALNSLEDISNDEDFVRCMRYLHLRETGPRNTMEDIAQEFGTSRGNLYKWINKWNKSGLLPKCRQALMVPMTEQVIATNLRAVNEWHEVFNRQLETAKSGRSDKISLEAAQWLWAEFVKPATENQNDAGAAEIAYIQEAIGNQAYFDPMSFSPRVTETPEDSE